MKTVLVTGATGFLGSHLVHALLSEDLKVVILKRSISDSWRISDVIEDVKSYDVDTQSVKKAFEENDIDIVIHTACNYGRNNESITEVVETNILFGLEVLECSIKFSVDTFLNTDTLLQKHLNIYTRSKKQFVEWVKTLSDKIQVVNLKLEHMYGPKDGSTKFVPWVIAQLFDEVDEIKLTSGEQKRDFIFIDDVVSAYLTVIRNKEQFKNFSEFDVGTGNLITVRSFVRLIKDLYEKHIGKSQTKLRFGAIEYREGEIMNIEIRNQDLLDLGWNPSYTVDKGLQNLIKNYEN